MAADRFDNDYLRGFFGIGPGPEGDAEVAAIRKRLIRLQFGHGQDICRIDQKEDGMYFLDQGSAIVLDRDGKQINVLNEGQYFGEYAVLSGQRRLSTVRSHGRTVVYRLSSSDVIEILQRHPEVYGEFMKRVYAQVTHKHRQLLALSRLHRGILRHPDGQKPMTGRRMLIQYGALALVFLLSALFVPAGNPALMILLPLLLMLTYVLITHQTLEALIAAALYMTLLVHRGGVIPGFTDELLKTIGDPDNVFTVLVMALIGSFVSLIEASGAITAFRRIMQKRAKSPAGVRFGMLGILAITAVDDYLNMLCASGSSNDAAQQQRLSCEDRALLLSFLPTALCSFVPMSIWGVFVIGSILPSLGKSSLELFLSSIPFNFFSILVLLAMLLHCAGKLPKSRQLKNAEARVQSRGALYPDGSEPFLTDDGNEIWGRVSNLLIPIAVLVAGSLGLRSVFSHSFVLDSACGLFAAILVMFFLYCGQRLMSPEQFFEHMITGMQSMVLPNILYLLTMCFTTMLSNHALDDYFINAVSVLQPISALLPAALFLLTGLLTVALGSSWAAYVIALPAALRIAAAVGLNVPLCIGAICAAGIAGEKCCVFTGDEISVGEAIGCVPAAVLSLRLPYALWFSAGSFALYLIAGNLFQ